MILAGAQQAGKPGYPWLVFLHGFSGDCREWQTVGEALSDYPRLYLDLPGHGRSASMAFTGFKEMSDVLTRTLVSYNILNYWLVGYSLGGRIAMFHACQDPAGLCGIIVEGGHPGLKGSQHERQEQHPTICGRSVFARSPSQTSLPTGINSLSLPP